MNEGEPYKGFGSLDELCESREVGSNGDAQTEKVTRPHDFRTLDELVEGINKRHFGDSVSEETEGAANKPVSREELRKAEFMMPRTRQLPDTQSDDEADLTI